MNMLSMKWLVALCAICAGCDERSKTSSEAVGNSHGSATTAGEIKGPQQVHEESKPEVQFQKEPYLCAVWYNLEESKYAYAIDLSLSPPWFGQGSAESLEAVAKAFAFNTKVTEGLLIITRYEGNPTPKVRPLSQSEISELTKGQPRWKIFQPE